MKKQRPHIPLHVGLLLALVGLIGATALLLGPARRASAQAAASWSYTGSLNTARTEHTATLLQNGKVLVAGGNGSDGNHIPLSLNSAEVYDPATEMWSNTGNLNIGRVAPIATLLQNGKVLVAGGYNFVAFQGPIDLSSAELYDPATGTWSYTGSLNTARRGPTATLLQNGKVLVAGGYNFVPFQGSVTFNSAELYDPATGTWSYTGSLNTPLGVQTATLLSNGKVLAISGSADTVTSQNAAELYDPATGSWSMTGSLNSVLHTYTATLLPNGKVLVLGIVGCSLDDCDFAAELYDPTTGLWINTDNPGIYEPTATLLPSGKILLVGYGGFATLYDPAVGTFSGTANLNTGRRSYTTTLLPNGKVLVTDGGVLDSPAILNTAELYDPGTSSTPNPIDDAQFFVRQHYLDFLNREPDPSGLAFWTNEISSCGTDQSCIEAKRINVSAAFFLSIEFQQTGYLVYRFHKAAYGNLPGAAVPIRRAEFLPDTQQIGQGVIVNQAGWETVLEINKQAFSAEFVQRSRFTSAYTTSMTPAEFVDKLFANAGVTPTSNERTAAINEFGLASTTSDAAARARALRRVAENSTLSQQEFNRAFVLMQYFGYLRRNPNDPPEPTLDFQGYNFWLTKLNQFTGNFVNAEMVKAFLVSSEYRQRFGQP